MHPHPTQHWPPLMCSLVDQLPEPKETQLNRVQPHSAAVLSVPESVVEVSCILMMLSVPHARIEVWLLHTLALLNPLIDPSARTVQAASCKCCGCGIVE